MLRYLLLPLRAPMLLLLILVSIYMGAHWMGAHRPLALDADHGQQLAYAIFWPIQCLQTVVVVMVCAMPDLLLRNLSLVMASSKVITLVVTLLLAITGGLYLLHLNIFTDVVILASSVLLARLDLTRLRVVPPPFVGAMALSTVVLIGLGFGAHLQRHQILGLG